MPFHDVAAVATVHVADTADEMGSLPAGGSSIETVHSAQLVGDSSSETSCAVSVMKLDWESVSDSELASLAATTDNVIAAGTFFIVTLAVVVLLCTHLTRFCPEASIPPRTMTQPSPSFALPPLPSSVPFSPIPFPSLRSRTLSNPVRGPARALGAPLLVSGAEPQPKSNCVHFSLKI